MIREAAPASSLFSRRRRLAAKVLGTNVLVQDRLEPGGDVVALERGEVLAVHVDGRFGLLEGARQRDRRSYSRPRGSTCPQPEEAAHSLQPTI
jgi:hypothetical protein